MPAILAELSAFEEKVAASKGQAAAEKATETLRRALNVLLDRQFIYNGDRGMAHLYEALLRTDARQIVEGVLDAFGYSLVMETTDQWVGVVPNEDGEFHGARLRIDETIVLLLLGLIWQEGMNTGISEDRATVPTTSEEVFSRHAAILGRERIPRARFQEILQDLKRRSLVELGEEDPETRDILLRIRSTIRLVSGEAQLQLLERFAQESERRLDSLDRERARTEAEQAADGNPSADEGEEG